jgi:polysaccharide export outer membrane protein
MKNVSSRFALSLSFCAPALIGCLAATTPALAQNKPPTPKPVPPSAPQTTEPTRPPAAGYRLAPNDTVNILVFQEDELQTTARIGKDGSIPFPLVGTISLGGRTVPEAAAAVSQALKDYLVHPQVAVRIADYSKKRFTVLGQVNRPGTFDLPDESPLSLLEGIGLAGGYSRIANPSKVIVKRRGPGGEQVFLLNAKQMAKGNAIPSFQILPGDTVVVEESLF